jgi:hypothetical protein
MLSILLLILYPLAIQYEVRKWPIRYLYYAVGIIDIIANYTELALFTLDRPRAGEYTFSQRLRRLQYGNRYNRLWARTIIPYLNFFQANHVPK